MKKRKGNMKKINELALDIQRFAEDTAEETANTADNAADNGANEQKQPEETPVKESKTFTQDEVNAIVQERLKKEKKGIPSKEELKAYSDWKESQKSEEEKRAEKEKENQQVLTERDNLKRENLLLRKGVNDDDLDYVLFKVSRLEGEFEENLTKYLADNPKYLKNYEEPKKTIDLGGNHSEKKPDDDDFINRVMGLK